MPGFTSRVSKRAGQIEGSVKGEPAVIAHPVRPRRFGYQAAARRGGLPTERTFGLTAPSLAATVSGRTQSVERTAPECRSAEEHPSRQPPVAPPGRARQGWCRTVTGLARQSAQVSRVRPQVRRAAPPRCLLLVRLFTKMLRATSVPQQFRRIRRQLRFQGVSRFGRPSQSAATKNTGRFLQVPGAVSPGSPHRAAGCASGRGSPARTGRIRRGSHRQNSPSRPRQQVGGVRPGGRHKSCRELQERRSVNLDQQRGRKRGAASVRRKRKGPYVPGVARGAAPGLRGGGCCDLTGRTGASTPKNPASD